MKSHTRQDNFRTLARHIKCSFLPVREESGLPVGLVEDEFTRQKQNEMFYISILFTYVTECFGTVFYSAASLLLYNENLMFQSGKRWHINAHSHWMKTTVTIKFFKTDRKRATYHYYGKQLYWRCFHMYLWQSKWLTEYQKDLSTLMIYKPIKRAVSRNSAKFGNNKMPVKIR